MAGSEGFQVGGLQHPVAIEIQHVEEPTGGQPDEAPRLLRRGLEGGDHAGVGVDELLAIHAAAAITVAALVFVAVGLQQHIKQLWYGRGAVAPAGMNPVRHCCEVAGERMDPVTIAVVEAEQAAVAIRQSQGNLHRVGGLHEADHQSLKAAEAIAQQSA
jgi:hypothetical protein